MFQGFVFEQGIGWTTPTFNWQSEETSKIVITRNAYMALTNSIILCTNKSFAFVSCLQESLWGAASLGKFLTPQDPCKTLKFCKDFVYLQQSFVFGQVFVYVVCVIYKRKKFFLVEKIFIVSIQCDVGHFRLVTCLHQTR